MRFKLSAAAKVKVVIQRQKGKTFSTVRVRRLAGRAGANVTTLGAKPFKPGRYRVLLTATNAGGTGKASVKFRVTA